MVSSVIKNKRKALVLLCPFKIFLPTLPPSLPPFPLLHTQQRWPFSSSNKTKGSADSRLTQGREKRAGLWAGDCLCNNANNKSTGCFTKPLVWSIVCVCAQPLYHQQYLCAVTACLQLFCPTQSKHANIECLLVCPISSYSKTCLSDYTLEWCTT